MIDFGLDTVAFRHFPYRDFGRLDFPWALFHGLHTKMPSQEPTPIAARLTAKFSGRVLTARNSLDMIRFVREPLCNRFLQGSDRNCGQSNAAGRPRG